MTAADMNEEVFACPVFEGSEKRISVTFAAGPNTPPHGLRSLSRAQLDAMLDLAACQIVSYRSNAHFDAYVLSESSLFVYPDRMVLKTCGTTKLLSCVEYMEELAASLGMAPSRVKYTRASFLFPEQQPAPHTSFDHECQFLHGAFSRLGRTSAYVLGDALNGLQWHVFVAGLCDLPAKPLAPPPPRRRQPPLSPTWPAGGTNPPAAACRCSLGSRCHCCADFGTDEAGLSSQSAERPIYTLEVCMTGLSARKAAQFFRGEDFVSAQHVTLGSGIQGLVPGAVIDDYVFEPCGYSMNGQQGGVFSTIHITPEDGFSYASFELCGYDPEAVDTADLVSRVVEVFHPRQVGVTLSLDSSASAAATLGWSGGFLIPPKYVAHSSSYQEFKAGGYVAYFALEGERAAAGKAGSDSDASSPRAVLKHCPSFHTITPLGSEDAMHDTASDDSRGAGAHVGSPSAFMRASLMSSMSGLSLMGSSAEIGVEDVLALHNAVPLLRGDGASVDGHMRGLISRHRLEDTFFVVDLGAVQRCYSAWTEAMPGVRPYYTVRCNPDRALLSMLAALGCGFSCAAESEVHLVLSLGIPADRILFSSACKRPRDVRFAAQKGVRLTTFACVGELCKLARWQPGARALLRLTAAHSVDSAGAAGRGADGADPASWTELFQTAQALGVEVAGVSVALGAAADVDRALALAKQAFDTGRAHGCAMKVLDIGCAAFESAHCQAGDTLATLTAALCPALDAHFPTGCGVRVMAEAGHCFAESAATLASLVYARRLQPSGEGYDYWVAADGQAWAGSDACGAAPGGAPRALLMHGAGAKAAPCTVHGPAAGALCCALPECQEGDWVVLPRWGAYCGAGEVLGAMDTPTFYVCSREA